MEETLFKLTRAITDTGTDTVSSEGGTITYRITSLKRKLVNGKVVSTSTPSCTLGSVSVASVSAEHHYMLSLTALSSNQTGANRSGHLFLTCGDANLSIPVTQKSQEASTFTLSGLPTGGTGYYLFGRGARPQNTSSSQRYIHGISATGTTTMRIPFYANDSEPGSSIECTTGDKVAVYTKPGATWILEGSFRVPSAGGTVSI